MRVAWEHTTAATALVCFEKEEIRAGFFFKRHSTSRIASSCCQLSTSFYSKHSLIKRSCESSDHSIHSPQRFLAKERNLPVWTWNCWSGRKEGWTDGRKEGWAGGWAGRGMGRRMGRLPKINRSISPRNSPLSCHFLFYLHLFSSLLLCMYVRDFYPAYPLPRQLPREAYNYWREGTKIQYTKIK